jgi:hypothetical protein
MATGRATTDASLAATAAAATPKGAAANVKPGTEMALITASFNAGPGRPAEISICCALR